MRKKKPDQRPCTTCGGSGTVDLKPWLQTTLDLIKAKGVTPRDVADKLEITINTANMRLRQLLDYGLVEREPVQVEGGGQSYLYKRVKGGGS